MSSTPTLPEPASRAAMPARPFLYLTNSCGLSAQQRTSPLVALVDELGALGADVWEPFRCNYKVKLGLAIAW